MQEIVFVFLKNRLPVFVVLLLLGGGASIAKSSGFFLPQIGFAEYFVGGHQYLHLIVATVLSFLAVWSTSPKAKKFLFNSVGWPSILLLILVITDELLQFYLPSRHYSLIDMSINVFGIIAGIFIYTFVSLIKEKIKVLVQ